MLFKHDKSQKGDIEIRIKLKYAPTTISLDIIHSCFQLIGYPDWWGDKPRGNGRGVGCGQGEIIRGCGGPVRANATIVGTQESTT